MWVRGGRLLSDELGLYMDALQWWQDARHHAPNEVTPIVEQAAILADVGLYAEASERLQSILMRIWISLQRNMHVLLVCIKCVN